MRGFGSVGVFGPLFGLWLMVGPSAGPVRLRASAQEVAPLFSRTSLTEAQRKQMNELIRLARQYHASRSTGDVVGAVGALRQRVDGARALFGEDDAHVAESLDDLAKFCEDREDFAEARQARQRAIVILTRLLGDKHWRVTDARLALADCDLLAGMTPEQRRELRDAKVAFNQAGELQRTGHGRAAIPVMRSVIATRKRLLGEAHALYATSLNRLGFIHWSLNEYDQAEPLYRQALAIRKQTLGEMHPECAVCVNNLATLLLARGEQKQSDELLEQALSMMKKLQGEESAVYASLKANQATLLATRGDYTRAETTLRQSLKIAARADVDQEGLYPRMLTSLSNILEYAAGESLGREEFDKAKQALWERQAIEAELHGDSDWRATDARLEWADADRISRLDRDRRRQFDEANRLLADASNAHAQKRLADAIRDAEAALEHLNHVFGESNPRTVRTLASFAPLYARTGNLDKAMSKTQTAAERLRQVLGGDHPEYAAVVRNMARLHELRGDDATAERLFREAVAILKEAVGEDTPAYSNSFQALADFLKRSAKRAKATEVRPGG